MDFKTDYNVDSSKKIMTKIGVGSQASSVLDNVSYSNGCYGKILKNDGSERGDTVVTGDKLVVYKADGSVYDEYSIVIYGDVNGDGVIDYMISWLLREQFLELDSHRAVIKRLRILTGTEL